MAVKKEFMFEFSGGRLCLDFANTVENRGAGRGRRVRAGRERDLLEDYPRLLLWCRQAGILRAAEAARLAAAARRRPARARAVLQRARALREALFEIFSRVAAGHASRAADLAALNAALPRALARLRVGPVENGFEWRWERAAAPDDLLGAVARSAADLLTSPEAAAVRECAAGACRWLFLDRSRNGTRRWCDMKVCGNRNKARRHYRKVQNSRRGGFKVQGARRVGKS